MLTKALAIAGVALLGVAGQVRADQTRPADAGTGEVVAWVYLRGGSHVSFRAAGKKFPAQVGTPLLRSDLIEVPSSEFVVVKLRNGYVVKIDEDTSLAVAKIVSLDAPPTKESLAAQLDRVLTKEERGRAERIAGTQARLAGAEAVAPQSGPPATASRSAPPATPANESPSAPGAPGAPAAGSFSGGVPPGAFPGGYPPPGSAPGYPPPGAFPGGYPPAGGYPGAAPGAGATPDPTLSPTAGGADIPALPAGAISGKIVQSFRGDDGTITVYLNKGSKDKLRVGMVGQLLEGSEGGKPLDGATFKITKVIGENQAVAILSYAKPLGKNNRFMITHRK